MKKQDIGKDTNMGPDNLCDWKKEKGSSYYEILLNGKVIATIKKGKQMYKDFVSFYAASKKSEYPCDFMIQKEGDSFMVTFHSQTSEEYYVTDGMYSSNTEWFTNTYDINGNLLNEGEVEELDFGGPWN
jgi:hypothetical protein